jgi:hypothetical protein
MKIMPNAARLLGLGLVLATAPTLLPSISTPAWAQASGMGGVGQSDTITLRARVKAIDLKTRHVTLVGPEGNAVTVVAGPEVVNLAQIKPGNVVVLRYHTSAVFVLSAPGTPLPQNSVNVAADRAAPGQAPGAAAGARVVLTGLVVGVDPVHNTISLVNPKGGPVRTLDVKNPDNQRQLASVNVGDTITAVFTEAVAVSIEKTH